MTEYTNVVKVPFNSAEYLKRVRTGPCFVCSMLEGHRDYWHHVVYEDGETVVFLSKFPTLPAYCLVAPKKHIESWVDELTECEFLSFQRIVYFVAKAISKVVVTERMYSLSLGSQQGNPHLHWHVAPLPPGVPYREQQLQALMPANGILDVDDAKQSKLADALREHLTIEPQ